MGRTKVVFVDELLRLADSITGSAIAQCDGAIGGVVVGHVDHAGQRASLGGALHASVEIIHADAVYRQAHEPDEYGEGEGEDDERLARAGSPRDPRGAARGLCRHQPPHMARSTRLLACRDASLSGKHRLSFSHQALWMCPSDSGATRRPSAAR